MWVADGHGGSAAADVIAENIENLTRKYYPDIIQIFGLLDDIVCSMPIDAGSTLVMSFTHLNVVTIAHCGHSKAFIVGVDGTVLYETKTHTPCDPIEFERIYECKGVIRNGRLMGGLAVTRAIGNKEYKPYGLTCKPDVCKVHIMSDARLILATDGLWTGVEDFISKMTDAVVRVRDIDLAEELMKLSMLQDNTTVIVWNLL